MNKEKIVEFIKERGFDSISDFSKACNIDPSNINKNLNGSIKPNIKRMFIFAKVLKADISQIIYLFYTDEYKELIDIVNKSN